MAGGRVEAQQPGIERELRFEELEHSLLEAAHRVLPPGVHVALHGASPSRVLGKYLRGAREKNLCEKDDNVSPGRGCSSVGRASDRHATEAGSIARCGQGFFSRESAFSADSHTVSVKLPCAIACVDVCAHVKDPRHRQLYLCLDT